MLSFFSDFLKAFIKPLGFAFLAIVFILLLAPFYTYWRYAQDIKNKSTILNGTNTGLVLLDRNGNEFFSFDHAKDIQYIPLNQIPKAMQQAVIAAEDQNFYSNPGFSIRGTLRAFFTDISTGSFTEGGSTITQQLVKNSLLTPQKSLIRKYQEIILAIAITQQYSKQDILEMYLNSAYFGEGAFGIENAAQTYFGEDAQNLDVAQASLLAGLLPAPSSLSPLSNSPSKAKTEQKKVLDEMVNQGYISNSQATAAENENLVYNTTPEKQNIIAPHFAFYVRDRLIKQYGEEFVLRSGLRVTTTLNTNWQNIAQQTVTNQVENLRGNNVTNGAAVVIDPKSGEILAMVGSYDWNDPNFGKVNMAVSPRQPGSSFKPIIYATAFDEHLITPATILEDKPTVFPGNYKPHDYDYSYRGPVTVRRALANSLNIPAVEVMQEVGVSTGVQKAKDLGITSLKDPSNYGLSFILGAANVPLVEMTNVYATFANNGQEHPLTSILQVKNKYGQILNSYSPSSTQEFSDGASFLISSILSDNNARAEEFGNLLTIPLQAAVKTGTSEDFRDSLTLGYTPNLAIGAWVGNNNNSPMTGVAGSLGAAPIWKKLMTTFASQLPTEKFNPPPSVEKQIVCPYVDTSSNLASSSAYPEYFLDGTTGPTDCNQMQTSPAPTFSFPTVTIPSMPTQIPTPTEMPFPTQIPFPTTAPIQTEDNFRRSIFQRSF